MLDVLAVPYLILHVLDLFLGGIETHASHHVGNGTEWNFAIQLSCFSGMFILRSNLTVIEEIFEITHNLPIGTAFKQFWEGVVTRFLIKALCKHRKVDFPHIDA
jgi:hypothetical protein